MYKVLAVMVVCVSMLAVVGCKKEAEKACCGSCGGGEKAAVEKKADCPADCAKPCCAKKEEKKAE